MARRSPTNPNPTYSEVVLFLPFPFLCVKRSLPEKTGGGMEDGEGHFVKPAAAAAATVARGDSKKVFFLSLSISICCWTLLRY